MKVWIVGAQGTLKSEIASMLSEDKFKVGRLFTNLVGAEGDHQYHKEMYKHYDKDVISSIYENNAYVFMNDTLEKMGVYEGLEFGEYDEGNVFILSLDQFLSLNTKYISKSDLVVLVDGGKSWRFNNIPVHSEYDKDLREIIEKSCYVNLWNVLNTIKTSYKNVIYFNEEAPERVKTIIKIIYNNPKLKDEFVKNFSI